MSSQRLRFTNTAAAEFRAAIVWYNEQRNGLGLELATAIDAALESIKRNPLLYSIAFDEIRRCSLRKFPFGIFYSIDPEEIVIVGVYHVKRDSRKLRTRR